MNLTRRNFIKLGIFPLIALSACNKKERHENEWVATGNKKTFAEGTHVITNEMEYDFSTPNGQIQVPDGYRLFEAQEVVDSFGKFGANTKTIGTIYSFINTEPVEAMEYTYYDIHGNELKTEYPFAGEVIQKVFVKEVK